MVIHFMKTIYGRKMRSMISLCFILFAIQSHSQEAHRRWRKMNQIRNDKFDLILPEVMRENNIDMWIVM